MLDNLEWKRPAQVWKNKDYQLFLNGIEPDDIRQGYLGNCYYLASLSALAEFPERID